MNKIKITLEMGDEASTLSLNTDKSLIEIIEHIGKIRATESVEKFIEKQLLNEDGFIYESPDYGNTIYKRKIGQIAKTKIKGNTTTMFDMGGSYEVEVETPSSQWVCSYCGNNTYETESDYLIGVDHLSCALSNEREKKEKG